MDLVGMQIRENRLNLKVTVLRRENGTWHPVEVDNLCNGLKTESTQRPKHPEYVILFGHYTKEQTLEAIGGGLAYTAQQVTGQQNPELPFTPGFA